MKRKNSHPHHRTMSIEPNDRVDNFNDSTTPIGLTPSNTHSFSASYHSATMTALTPASSMAHTPTLLMHLSNAAPTPLAVYAAAKALSVAKDQPPSKQTSSSIDKPSPPPTIPALFRPRPNLDNNQPLPSERFSIRPSTRTTYNNGNKTLPVPPAVSRHLFSNSAAAPSGDMWSFSYITPRSSFLTKKSVGTGPPMVLSKPSLNSSYLHHYLPSISSNQHHHVETPQTATATKHEKVVGEVEEQLDDLHSHDIQMDDIIEKNENLDQNTRKVRQPNLKANAVMDKELVNPLKPTVIVDINDVFASDEKNFAMDVHDAVQQQKRSEKEKENGEENREGKCHDGDHGCDNEAKEVEGYGSEDDRATKDEPVDGMTDRDEGAVPVPVQVAVLTSNEANEDQSNVEIKTEVDNSHVIELNVRSEEEDDEKDEVKQVKQEVKQEEEHQKGEEEEEEEDEDDDDDDDDDDDWDTRNPKLIPATKTARPKLTLRTFARNRSALRQKAQSNVKVPIELEDKQNEEESIARTLFDRKRRHSNRKGKTKAAELMQQAREKQQKKHVTVAKTLFVGAATADESNVDHKLDGNEKPNEEIENNHETRSLKVGRSTSKKRAHVSRRAMPEVVTEDSDVDVIIGVDDLENDQIMNVANSQKKKSNQKPHKSESSISSGKGRIVSSSASATKKAYVGRVENELFAEDSEEERDNKVKRNSSVKSKKAAKATLLSLKNVKNIKRKTKKDIEAAASLHVEEATVVSVRSPPNELIFGDYGHAIIEPLPSSRTIRKKEKGTTPEKAKPKMSKTTEQDVVKEDYEEDIMPILSSLNAKSKSRAATCSPVVKIGKVRRNAVTEVGSSSGTRVKVSTSTDKKKGNKNRKTMTRENVKSTNDDYEEETISNNVMKGGEQQDERSVEKKESNSGTKKKRRLSEVFILQKALASAAWTDSKAVEEQTEVVDIDNMVSPVALDMISQKRKVSKRVVHDSSDYDGKKIAPSGSTLPIRVNTNNKRSYDSVSSSQKQKARSRIEVDFADEEEEGEGEGKTVNVQQKQMTPMNLKKQVRDVAEANNSNGSVSSPKEPQKVVQVRGGSAKKFIERRKQNAAKKGGKLFERPERNEEVNENGEEDGVNVRGGEGTIVEDDLCVSLISRRGKNHSHSAGVSTRTKKRNRLESENENGMGMSENVRSADSGRQRLHQYDRKVRKTNSGMRARAAANIIISARSDEKLPAVMRIRDRDNSNDIDEEINSDDDDDDDSDLFDNIVSISAEEINMIESNWVISCKVGREGLHNLTSREVNELISGCFGNGYD